MQDFTNRERTELYRQAFPKFEPLSITKSNRIEGLWCMGNNYTTSGYYGAYPHGYLKRIMSMFPTTPEDRVLHLFGGSLPPSSDYVRIDINPTLDPEVVGDAHELSQIFAPDAFDIIFADPPYSHEDAEHYGTCMIKRKTVMAECHTILKPGGWLIWLDQVLPIFSKANWNWNLAIAMVKSTNHRIRLICGFQKK